MLPVVVALGVTGAIRWRFPRVGWWVPPAAVVVVLYPIPALMLGVATLAVTRRNAIHRVREERARAEHDAVALAELVGLGLTAGLSFMAALEAAACEVGPPLADEVHDVIRRSRHRGIAAALEESGGAARRLYLLAARATVTGAPVAVAVRAYVAEQRDADRARALGAARRLPVQLLFPLALLILPGFMVLTIGPALLGALERLGM